jgi:tetratricopeptide (TPR) repeat protein
MERARAAATKAIELDDSVAAAHTSLGRVVMSFDLDWARVKDAFERAIALNQGYATAHRWRANLLLALGRTDQALAAMRRARELEPFSLILNTGVGWVLYMSRRYDEAIASDRATLEMEPNFGMAQREIALSRSAGFCAAARHPPDSNHHAHGENRRVRQGQRSRPRSGRLRDEAVQPPRADLTRARGAPAEPRRSWSAPPSAARASIWRPTSTPSRWPWAARHHARHRRPPDRDGHRARLSFRRLTAEAWMAGTPGALVDPPG